jgi:hypothetical protein
MWYKNNFKRNLIDMHIPDWNPEFLSKFDPEKYAESVSSSGADVALISTSSCLGNATYPTKIGHQHNNLVGKDIFGETVKACKKKGLKVIAYYNIFNRWAFEQNPDWRIYDENGKSPTVDFGGRFGICCSNSGFAEYVYSQVDELCDVYGNLLDGVWIDMIACGNPPCRCRHCQDKYKKATGKEMPEKADFTNPDWVKFMRLRQQWNADFAENIRNVIKSSNADLSVSFQFSSFFSNWKGGNSMRFLEQSDYLAGDFYLKPWEEAFVCKLLRSLSKNTPIEFMISACVGLEEHTTMKPIEAIALQMWMAISHLSAFVLIDAIDPIGTINRPLYDKMKPVFDLMTPYTPYMQQDWKQVADVAIYINPENYTGAKYEGCNIIQHQWDMYNIAKTMIKYNFLFDVATPNQLHALDKYKVVILTDTVMLSQKEIQALTEFVKNGGKLYVSARTGTIDEFGNLQQDFLLADVMGVHFQENCPWTVAYMSPTENSKEYFSYYRKDYPLCVKRKYTKIKTDDDTQIWATRADICGDPQDNVRFGSAISNPPTSFTDEPCLTLHNYGKGKVCYASAELESCEHDAQKEVFSNLISYLVEKPTIKSNAPSSMQINVFNNDKNQILLNVLNIQEETPLIPCHDIWVWLSTNQKVLSAKVVGSDTNCEWEEKDDGIIIHLPILHEFIMIDISFM